MDIQNKPGNSLGNFKFNNVGREEAATEVLRARIDPATRTRNVVVALVAAVALAGLLWNGFQQTGKKIWEKPRDTRTLQAPQTNVD